MKSNGSIYLFTIWAMARDRFRGVLQPLERKVEQTVGVMCLYRGGPHIPASMWHGRDLDLKGSFGGLKVGQDGGFGR